MPNEVVKCFNCPQNDSAFKCVGDFSCNSIDTQDVVHVVRTQIIASLKWVYKNHYDLITREINEVCIVSYFWHYFIKRFLTKHPMLNIDMEYNKNGESAKRYGMGEQYARPDIIIHKRNCNKWNTVIFEFKSQWNQDGPEVDYQKLKNFTCITADINEPWIYAYKCGVSVLFGKEEIILKWFHDGHQDTTIDKINTSDWMINQVESV
ncbi:MAG: hypothetical protein QM689_10515 [Oscillospiraceae bacterium]